MNFNSIEFVVFWLVVLMGFLITFRHIPRRNIWLLIASYFFYASWDWRYTGLILSSTIIDYFVCYKLDTSQNPRQRKILLSLSLIFNLGMLMVFKYFNFFMDSSNIVLNALGVDTQFSHLSLLLPVGISFYTFQTLSYTIDVYRKRIPTEKNFLNFATYVAFFPQLVAGPIVRASDFLPQLSKKTVFDVDKMTSGLPLVFRGFFKKMIIADLLAVYGVDAIFANPDQYNSLALLLGLYGYAIQIYCDFSGYSDIAIGLARMLGFDLCPNFNRPYISRSPSEFWKRWHISLSSWLRDYLYIPLGGNRNGKSKMYRNLLITMLLGGLWHGAAWHFVAWGALHGLLLIIARFWWPFQKSETKIGQTMGIIFTFHMVCLAWLLFRTPDMSSFATYFIRIISFQGGTHVATSYLGILMLGFAIHFIPQRFIQNLQERFTKTNIVIQSGIYASFFLVFIGVTQETPAFIYFQF